MVDRPPYADQGLLERVGRAAQNADLGAHREVFVRMLPRIQFATVMCGLFAAGLAAISVALISELFTRTDQTGGKAGDVVGLLVVVPLLLLFGVGFIALLYRGLFGPATSRAVRLDLYDRGLVSTADDEVRAVRYDTTVIYQELVRHLLYGVVETRTTHDYTLLDVTGEELRLQDYSQGGAPNAARWGAVIQHAVVTAQVPAAAGRLSKGDTVAFDELWLRSKEFGVAGNSVRWSQISQIAVQDGKLRIHAKGRWLTLTSTPVRKIPNIYVFLALAHQLIADSRRPRGGAAAGPAPMSPPQTTADDFQLLLTMVMGNHATAERLIAFERGKIPGADRATWIAKAIERLRRDRDRQG